MPANYVLLEKITVGAAGASSVTFSGIPQTGYTDLVVKCSMRSSTTDNSLSLQFNGSGINANRKIEGDGSAASSSNRTDFYLTGVVNPSNATASTFGNFELYIPNYTGNANKSFSVDAVTENNATLAYASLFSGIWNNTAAITSLTIGNALAANSTFYLYGVAKLGTTPAIVPYATGGDTIMTDGTYWYHTFVSSGTFTPQKALSVDYLVVAGGGGGGGSLDYITANGGGGGGAGGFRTATGFSCASGTGLTVTIGAGGAGGIAGSGSQNGSVGNDSVFSTITSTGGGYGSRSTGNTTPSNGGSGGGGGADSTPRTGGLGTAGQGNDGGAGVGAAFYRAGGGGGASAVGGVGSGSAPTGGGVGGAGTANSYSGSSVTYAGGGGGATYAGGSYSAGAGGVGGGGAGGTGVGGTAGTANSGGGGGGGGAGATVGSAGGNGGSGIVLVRYLV
jgi:hypothetical protein